jgi:hypothetical protein
MKRTARGLVVMACGLLMILAPLAANAGEADIVGVKIIKEGTGTYRFDVSVRHGDEGWKHYADGWDVVSPDGVVLGTRELAHPHENEQPFTRSLAGVSIPEGVDHVTLRAHDSVHGNGGAEMRVEVQR